MMKYILIAVLALLFISCGNNQNSSKNNEVIEENTTSESKALVLQAFTDLPDKIDGCSCLISENSTAFRANEYLYADNMQDVGFINIDGDMIELSLAESENDSEMEILTKGQNEEIEVTLDLRKSDQLDYVGSYFGTLEVKTKDGRTYKKTVFGECGC